MKLAFPLILVLLVAGEAQAYTPAPTPRPTPIPTPTPIPQPTAIPTPTPTRINTPRPPTPTVTPTRINTPRPPTPTPTPIPSVSPTPTPVSTPWPTVPTPTPAPGATPVAGLTCGVTIPIMFAVDNSTLGLKLELTFSAPGYETTVNNYIVDTTPHWERSVIVIGRPVGSTVRIRLLSSTGVEISNQVKTIQ